MFNVSEPFVISRPFCLLKEACRDSLLPLRRASPVPTRGISTNSTLNGKKVIFIHNPKTGGSSLASILGVKRLSHRYPREVLSDYVWSNCFSIVAVRDPFERFLSCYYTYVLRPGSNGLVKRYGQIIKHLTPFQLLKVIQQTPRFGGPQIAWTSYPSKTKPAADLILKFEEINRWTNLLAEVGLNIAYSSTPHLNMSERADSDHLLRLGLDADSFYRLRKEVMNYFKDDCKAFGYS